MTALPPSSSYNIYLAIHFYTQTHSLFRDFKQEVVLSDKKVCNISLGTRSQAWDKNKWQEQKTATLVCPSSSTVAVTHSISLRLPPNRFVVRPTHRNCSKRFNRCPAVTSLIAGHAQTWLAGLKQISSVCQDNAPNISLWKVLFTRSTVFENAKQLS
jgi:hypothetical protein